MPSTAHRQTILIVEDDICTRNLLACCFEREGYAVHQAGSGREMHDYLSRQEPDLILLDKILPDEDGLVLLRQLRTRSDVPIVMLSNVADGPDRLAGLDAGAGEYIAKSWAAEEMIARVKNVLGRCHPAPRRYLSFDRFTLDTEGHKLVENGTREVPLTTAEFRLLSMLARNKGKVLSRDQLLDALCNGADAPGDRVIDVHIAHLRRKLGDAGRPREEQIIQTVPSAGYRMRDC